MLWGSYAQHTARNRSLRIIHHISERAILPYPFLRYPHGQRHRTADTTRGHPSLRPMARLPTDQAMGDIPHSFLFNHYGLEYIR